MMDRPWTIDLFLGQTLVFVGCLIAQPAQAQAPWEGPAFSADPSAMLRSASAVQLETGVDTILLLQEDRFEYDDKGRATHIHRVVAKIVTKEGAQGWGRTDARWEGWHQQRPVLKARVITADGKVYPLDPAT